MFTVSFICQHVFSFVGIISKEVASVQRKTDVEYTALSKVYKLSYRDGVTRSSYFIQVCAVLNKLNLCVDNFIGALVAIMFRFGRLDFSHQLNAHSTNRNSDVLYLDRFTTIFSMQVIRRVGGVYSTISSLVRVSGGEWVVRFSPTSIVKYVNATYLNVFNVLYLRKTKVFNKGRYSRNRQFYRTGVYWCLYINIIAVIGMYFWFYRFVMNFGYLWWLFYLSLASFVAAKTLHFRLYTFSNLWNSISADIVWFAACLNTIVGGVLACKSNSFNEVFRHFSNLTFSYFLGMLSNAVNSLLISTNIYYVFVWFYNPANYYVQSLTVNPARVFLSSGKLSYFSQLRDLLVK